VFKTYYYIFLANRIVYLSISSFVAIQQTLNQAALGVLTTPNHQSLLEVLESSESYNTTLSNSGFHSHFEWSFELT
jgi:23S rRNA A1618 N6-methylase RlmF